MSPVLPVLKNDTVWSVLARFRGRNPAESYSAFAEEIGRENPAVSEAIFRFCEPIEDKADRGHAELCGLLVYSLLKSQGEADRLNHELAGRL